MKIFVFSRQYALDINILQLKTINAMIVETAKFKIRLMTLTVSLKLLVLMRNSSLLMRIFVFHV